MCTVSRICVVAAVVAAFGTPVSVSAQATPPVAGGLPLSLSQQPAADPGEVRRISADEAVRLAVENNLGIRIARYNPQIEDLNVLQARAGWAPTFTSTFQKNSTDSPNASLLAGSGSVLSDARVTGTAGIQQTMPWGGTYNVGWDGLRSTTSNPLSTFSPQLRSTLSLNYTQPLLRGWDIDNIRQQLQVSQKNREISDISLRQTLASTGRTVRNSYWNLAYAIASLQVQQQSLELAEQSLRDTRARVEIGTTPPIDIVEAESEVASRQEAVILAQAQIATAEDTLRALIYDPAMPNFWTIRIEPTDLSTFQPTTVNVDMVVRAALDRRTDLQQARRTLERNDVNIRFFRNQSLPEITASIDYGLAGLGGTQYQRAPGFPPGPILSQSERGFGSVLSDLFANEFPNWTASLNISYPIGTSASEANLARVRLQQVQTQTQLRSQELNVTTQVRQAAREVRTNQQRVEATRSSREFAERRLDAEQRKFAAGTSTSFIVFQVQNTLAVARNNELRAILDYNQSVVDLETVQEVPLGGQGTAVAQTGGGQTAAGQTAAGGQTTAAGGQ
jgi:outer membrane protein